MPRSLGTTGTVEPEASLPSACRSFRTICSGECLSPNFESPPLAHSGLLDSHCNWTRFRGLGHMVSLYGKGWLWTLGGLCPKVTIL